MVKNPPAMQETPVQFLGWDYAWRRDRLPTLVFLGFPGGSVVKNPLAIQRPGFDLWIGKIPWRRKCQPIPVFLPGKFNGKRRLVGKSMGSKTVRHD